MSHEHDLARIAHQEKWLRFKRFDANDAWSLGSRLRQWAAEGKWPVMIDIRRFDAPLFFAALPGSVPDNVEWIRRKTNVVTRFHRSSYGLGRELDQMGATLESRFGLPLADYAAHGGGFPIAIEDTGVIGSVTVSGLPQRDDHNLVVRALCDAIGLPEQDFVLAAPA